jgi:hypothetical protein
MWYSTPSIITTSNVPIASGLRSRGSISFDSTFDRRAACANSKPVLFDQLRPSQAKESVVLNEAQPFHCVRCAKPFGTKQMVDNMLAKLSGHSMFAGGVRRLQMCADCRVVDMVENKSEATIFDYPKQ